MDLIWAFEAPGSTLHIPGDIDTIETMELQVQGKCILVIEKEAFFQQLITLSIENSVILITAKGFPDQATRALLKQCELIGIPMGILTDYDPHGFLILKTFQESKKQPQWALKSIKWLGLFDPEDDIVLNSIGGNVRHLCTPLKQRDSTILANVLKNHLTCKAYRSTLEKMRAKGFKCELEIVSQMGPEILRKFFFQLINNLLSKKNAK